VKRILLILLTVAMCVGCDQATKSMARDHLPRYKTLSFACDTVRLQYAENRGAFLSLGASLPERVRSRIFTVGVAAFLVVVLGYLLLAPGMPAVNAFAFSLVVGGGLGNLLDRVAYGGGVTDFMNLGIGPLRTGIFNAADVAIMAGTIVLVFGSLVRPKPPGSRRHAAEPGLPEER
jgi:signal peptidase II